MDTNTILPCGLQFLKPSPGPPSTVSALSLVTPVLALTPAPPEPPGPAPACIATLTHVPTHLCPSARQGSQAKIRELK